MYGNVSWYGRSELNFPQVEAGGCFGFGGTNQRSMLKNGDGFPLTRIIILEGTRTNRKECVMSVRKKVK